MLISMYGKRLEVTEQTAHLVVITSLSNGTVYSRDIVTAEQKLEVM